MRLLSIAEKLPAEQSVQCCSMENGEKLDDFNLFRPRKSSILVRRCKSVNGTVETTPQGHKSVLKTRPFPTSPKKVHFADSNGHDLVEVKNYSVTSEERTGWALPLQLLRPRSFTIPQTKHSHLESEDRLVLPCFSLKPCFDQPKQEDIQELVERNSVCLESFASDARWLTIVCRVLNRGYCKEVSVRFTSDHWKSFTEIHATHIFHYGSTDQFEVKIHVPKRVKIFEFALRYRVDDMEFWDNNQTKNYLVETER